MLILKGEREATLFCFVYLTIWYLEELTPFGCIMKMGNAPTDGYGVHKGMVGRAKVPFLWGLDVLSMTSTTSMKGFS